MPLQSKYNGFADICRVPAHNTSRDLSPNYDPGHLARGKTRRPSRRLSRRPECTYGGAM